MKCYSLFSGSSGNCIYLEEKNTRVLVDAGGSMRRVEEALQKIGASLSGISAVLVTHEHTDHTQALGMIVKNYPIRVYCQQKVAKELYLSLLQKPDKSAQAAAFARAVRTIEAGLEYEERDLVFVPFQTPHDSVDSAGFVFGEGELGIATDLGCVTSEVEKSLLGCHSVILEANHDLEMLQNGPYPPYLRARVASDRGHLNNLDSAAFCARLLAAGCQNFTLFHLSAENNTPVLARTAALEALVDAGGREESDFLLRPAARFEVTKVL